MSQKATAESKKEDNTEEPAILPTYHKFDVESQEEKQEFQKMHDADTASPAVHLPEEKDTKDLPDLRNAGNKELARRNDGFMTQTETVHVEIPEDLIGRWTGEVEPLPSTELSRGDIRSSSRPGAHPVQGPFAARYRTDFFETAESEHIFQGHIEEESPSSLDQQSHLYEGTVVPNTRPDRSSKKGWLLIAAATLLGALVMLLFIFVPASPNAGEEEHTIMSGPVEIVAGASNEPFSKDLPEFVISSIIHERDSPFYHANLWLLNDPNLESHSVQRKKQRFYLAVLFYATNGENWTNNNDWLSHNVSECEWFSSSSYNPDSLYYEPRICDGNGTIINLSLANNNLDGTLPIWYTSFLPYLQVWDIANNKIGGQLPAITTSEHLKVWVFSHTGLTGIPIINMMGYFVNLKVMEWVDVKVTANGGGALMTMVPNIEVFNISGLLHSSPIPTNMGTLTHLQNLGLGGLQAQGTIPSELGKLTDLVHLDLSRLPNISGSLPSELGQLTKLTQLDLAGTPLTGTVPANLCNRVTDGLLSMQANCSVLECCQ
jgi:hypothetical protein